jgi:glycosyltransferase involved in cell wall biosynthesis
MLVMSEKKIKELQGTINRQKKVIESYESTAKVFKYLKKSAFLGSTARMLAGSLKGGKKAGTKFINGVVSDNPRIIAVCSPEFRGVRSATKELVDDIIEISEITSQRIATDFAKKIISYNPKAVLISGYAYGHDKLAEELKKAKPDLRIFVLIHSAFIWFDVYPTENKTFERFLDLNKDGLVEKIGFCKRDLAEYFKELGYNSFFVMNRFYPEKHQFKALNKGKLKIGIWGKNMWHRNITNQVVAALMIPDAEIHVNEVAGHSFLDISKITVHGMMPKEEFHKILSEMDINLYVSMTDCFPMTLIESMQFGIPALASDTSDVYTFNKALHSRLTVSTVDGPIGIKKKVEEIIDNYEEIQNKIKLYLPILKEKTERSIEEFLK